MTNDDPHATNDESPSSPPMSPKRLNAIIGYISSVAVACAVIMWSVFNTWLNVLAYRADEKADQAWGIAAVMVFFTCILPFCFGIGILISTLNKNQSGGRNK